MSSDYYSRHFPECRVAKPERMIEVKLRISPAMFEIIRKRAIESKRSFSEEARNTMAWGLESE